MKKTFLGIAVALVAGMTALAPAANAGHGHGFKRVHIVKSYVKTYPRYYYSNAYRVPVCNEYGWAYRHHKKVWVCLW